MSVVSPPAQPHPIGSQLSALNHFRVYVDIAVVIIVLALTNLVAHFTTPWASVATVPAAAWDEIYRQPNWTVLAPSYLKSLKYDFIVLGDWLAVPLRLRHGGKELAFFSMTAVVGAPLDVTVAEVAIESFYPADADTAEVLHAQRK